MNNPNPNPNSNPNPNPKPPNPNPKPRIICAVCGVPYIATSKPTHCKSRKHLIGAQMILAAKLKSEALLNKENESSNNQ